MSLFIFFLNSLNSKFLTSSLKSLTSLKLLIIKSIKYLKLENLAFFPITPGYLKLSLTNFSILLEKSLYSFCNVFIREFILLKLFSASVLNLEIFFIFWMISLLLLSTIKLWTLEIYLDNSVNFFSKLSHWFFTKFCSFNFIFNFSSSLRISFKISFLKNKKSWFILLFSGLKNDLFWTFIEFVRIDELSFSSLSSMKICLLLKLSQIIIIFIYIESLI